MRFLSDSVYVKDGNALNLSKNLSIDLKVNPKRMPPYRSLIYEETRTTRRRNVHEVSNKQVLHVALAEQVITSLQRTKRNDTIGAQ